MNTNDETGQSLGSFFRASRESQGLSQSELGRRSGVDAGQISLVETGKRESPQFITVARIAYSLGLSLDAVASAVHPQYQRVASSTSSAIADEVISLRADLAELAESIGQMSAIICDVLESLINGDVQTAKQRLRQTSGESPLAAPQRQDSAR